MVSIICVIMADWLNQAQVLLGSRVHSAPYGVIASTALITVPMKPGLLMSRLYSESHL